MNKQMADSVDHTKDGACSQCGQCCSCLLILSEGEIAKIKKYLKEHPEVKMKDRNSALQNKFVDVCPFLNEENECEIYSVRPQICSRFICSRFKDPDYKPLDHSYKKIVNMVETFMNKECSNAPDIKELNKMYQEKKREAGLK